MTTDVRIERVLKANQSVVRGTYTEVDPPKLLKFTWQWDHEGWELGLNRLVSLLSVPPSDLAADPA